jgi:hypothetical protein
MTSHECLRINLLLASLGVRSHIGNRQDLFRICIGFQILSRKSSPELGSDYGTKPSRSFHEETVHPHCPGNCAHSERVPQRVSQRVHQHVSQRLIRNTDRKPGLLRRRSGRTGRSGLCSGIRQYASQCRNGSDDNTRNLLRRRSGRTGRSGLCSGIRQHASQCRNGSIDQTRLELIQVGRLSVQRDGQ